MTSTASAGLVNTCYNAGSFLLAYVDCGDTNSCAIPMWFQYVIVAVALLMLGVKCLTPRDPFDRW